MLLCERLVIQNKIYRGGAGDERVSFLALFRTHIRIGTFIVPVALDALDFRGPGIESMPVAPVFRGPGSESMPIMPLFWILLEQPQLDI